MQYEEFLRKVPKVELHCHLEGSVRATTFADMARKHGVTLPTSDPSKLYEYDNITDFLNIYVLVCRSMTDHEDFARAAYETLEDGVRDGNLKYREMFFSPTNHYPDGVTYRVMVDGLIEGIRAAEQDLGVRCRLIPAINRQEPLSMALDLVSDISANPREEVIGIGMDHAEALGPPEGFADAYLAAAKAGLHRTAHACEDAPPHNITTALDVLGCERIDHGYHVLEDQKVVDRCRDQGVFFTCCMHSTAMVYGWRDLPNHPIKGMVEQGLSVMLNSDDPPMFHTDIGQEYVSAATQIGYGPDRVRQFCLNGIEASWLDDVDKRAMRREFDREITDLMSRLEMA
jgi:adenosine deaminase